MARANKKYIFIIILFVSSLQFDIKHSYAFNQFIYEIESLIYEIESLVVFSSKEK